MLICMQNINFITRILLKYGKKIATMLFSLIRAWLSTHLKWYYQFEETFDIYLRAKKIKFILYIFLEILQRYCELVILGSLGMPGYTHSITLYTTNLWRTAVHLQARNQLYPPRFSGDLQTSAKISKLLILVLWACLTMLLEIDSMNLYRCLSASQK